ncbi:MAG: hypothetical protein IPM16_12690 [Chloroflexi bacterium]|nr:hypothetical protein [Chloroflexota bacterium]
MNAPAGSRQCRLLGDWEVYPVPLDNTVLWPEPPSGSTITVPDASHLQPVLYPENPYWGDRVRAVNESAWMYRRGFTVAPEPYRRARLRFGGVDYFASVWFNGQYLGGHEGHFTTFEFDVTHALLHDEENLLHVRVSAPWDAPNPGGTFPSDHVLRGLVKGNYEHGEGLIPPAVNPIGIWRPVYLIFDHGVSIDRLRIRTHTDGAVSVRATLTNATHEPWFGRLVLDAQPENHHGAGTQVHVSLRLPVGTHQADVAFHIPDPQLWWPWDHGEPNLYRVTCQLIDSSEHVIADHTETFGLRTVRLERTRQRFTYEINGQPVYIRGTSYMPDLYLSRCTHETLERDLQLTQDANLNLVRVHVHRSPDELYDICDRAGMLIWQDFELNWIHASTHDFEARARRLQNEMIASLYNHPAIITWSCHNEPTMVFTRRENLERQPDPTLYADAKQQDPTRPVFICSGQMEHDWLRAGDVHTYYGAIWTDTYTDVYRHKARLNTEFGFEAPAHADTLRSHPDCWERLQHLTAQIDDLWTYQAELVRFHVEHYRRLRAQGCAGYIHFWLADLVPQVGCGVLDSDRRPKGGYAALRDASQPVHVALEHNGRRPFAVWVFNDTNTSYEVARVRWRVCTAQGSIAYEGTAQTAVPANAVVQVLAPRWNPKKCDTVELVLEDPNGGVMASSSYVRPFKSMRRPVGYPWKFDPYLGCKVFDRSGAPSLADQSTHWFVSSVPLVIRERVAEWALRQRVPAWVMRAVAQIIG